MQAESVMSAPTHGVSLLLATHVGDDHLVLVGSFDGFLDDTNVVVLDRAGRAHEVAARCWRDPAGLHSILAVPVAGLSTQTVVVEDVPFVLHATREGLQPVLRFGPSAADSVRRAEIIAFLVSALAGRQLDDLKATVSDELWGAREGLRDRSTPSVVDTLLPPGMQIELTIGAGRRGVYLRGWIGEPNHRLRRVTAVSPEGERVELLDSLFRFRKSDVADFYGLRGPGSDVLGVAALVRCRHQTVRRDGWLVEVETIDGRCFESDCPPVATDASRSRERLLYEMTLETSPSTSLRSEHIGPAMSGLLDAGREHVHIVDVVQYGSPPTDPNVTIVVPLYRRIDFVEHQLAQFVHDPDIADTDLVYVLDSPELAAQLVDQCARLHRLYRIPFRVVILSENSGFSTANNMGVSVARGRLLLLMNSDVLPVSPGWLGSLVSFHDSIPNVGCVGPKLLYEDDSIQHAGMYFERAAGAATWVNEHHFKGMHRSFAPASVDRRVAAITGACLLMDTALYRSIGGLLGSFVQGDYEDSDLCLRLHELGLENWYSATTELYHLEGQSYPSPLRILNHDFNSWLHTSMWDHTIASIASIASTSEVH